MPRSLQGDPGWNRDPRGWGKKELIPNATPFQSVITQCPFAAFSVCVHTFSALSLSVFTQCPFATFLSVFIYFLPFHCLCSHSVHLPLFYVHTFFTLKLCSHSVHLPLFYVHTFSTLSLCSHSVHLPLFSLCLYIFGLSQSVFTQCPFGTFHCVCSHSVHLPPFLCSYVFIPFTSVFTQYPFATFSMFIHFCPFHSLCSHGVHLPPFHSLYSYGVHLLPFSVSG